MYVEQLDRAWTDTTFTFQGFIIRTEAEMADLRRCCRHVFVNDVKSQLNDAGRARLDGLLRPHTRRTGISDITFERWDGEEKLKRTLQSINRLKESVDRDISLFCADAAGKYMVDSNRVSLIAAEIYRALELEPRLGKWITSMQTAADGLAEHSRNVAVLAMGFARHLGVTEYLVTLIGEGALLHDIGLARVPASIMKKRERANERELALLRLHPSYARNCLQSYVQIPQEMIDIIELHHVRLDGSGYPPRPPRQVPDYVFIVAICDVFVEMTSYRNYLEPLAPEEALLQLDRMGRKQLPTKLVQEFIAYLGIYPRGNFVMLENGAIGVVVSTNHNYKTRPVLRMVRGPAGGDVEREYVDLSVLDQRERDAGWRVVKSVHPMKLGVDSGTPGKLFATLHGAG